MRRENGARAFIAPPLGGWEGLNQQESVTVDASGGNWHSLLTASPFCPACPGICALVGRRSGTDGRRGQACCASGRASLWTAPAATVSPARGSKSGSPLGGEVAQGTGAKPASQKVIAASAKRAAVAERDEGLTAFPIWAGRERQRPGGDKSGRRPTAFFQTQTARKTY